MKRILKFFGMMGHSCKEVAEKLQVLLDGELDQETEKKLIKEIENCSGCLEHYKIEDAFKKFMHNKLERKCCTGELKKEILEKIQDLG